MKDTEFRLLRCIGSIDDEPILEADTMRFKPRRWGHLAALAACLALVLTIPAFLKSGPSPYESAGALPTFLNQSKGSSEAGTPYEDAAIVTEEASAAEGSNYDLSLGGIQLGMTEADVFSILGKPMDQENGWLNYNGISIEISQFQPQVITIDLRNGPLTLPSGIGPGSSVEELQKVYPELERNDQHEDVLNPGTILYSLDQGDQRMTVAVQNGQVIRIIVEHLGDLMLEALSVNKLTIYQWEDTGWSTTEVIDKAAKYICTVLTISEPDPPTAERSGTSLWMDFGNGTAVEVYGNDHAAVFTYEGTFDPEQTDGLTLHLDGEFTGLDQYLAQALEDPDLGWD